MQQNLETLFSSISKSTPLLSPRTPRKHPRNTAVFQSLDMQVDLFYIWEALEERQWSVAILLETHALYDKQGPQTQVEINKVALHLVDMAQPPCLVWLYSMIGIIPKCCLILNWHHDQTWPSLSTTPDGRIFLKCMITGPNTELFHQWYPCPLPL